MGGLEIQLAGADELVELPLKRIFHIGVPGQCFTRLGPKVTNGIRSSQRQRNQVINFVVASLVLRDTLLGVRLSLKPCRHRSDLLCVAGNAHVLGGYVERITRRGLRIGKNWRGLLGAEGLNEKQAICRWFLPVDATAPWYFLGIVIMHRLDPLPAFRGLVRERTSCRKSGSTDLRTGVQLPSPPSC